MYSSTIPIKISVKIVLFNIYLYNICYKQACFFEIKSQKMNHLFFYPLFPKSSAFSELLLMSFLFFASILRISSLCCTSSIISCLWNTKNKSVFSANCCINKLWRSIKLDYCKLKQYNVIPYVLVQFVGPVSPFHAQPFFSDAFDHKNSLMVVYCVDVKTLEHIDTVEVTFLGLPVHMLFDSTSHQDPRVLYQIDLHSFLREFWAH